MKKTGIFLVVFSWVGYFLSFPLAMTQGSSCLAPFSDFLEKGHASLRQLETAESLDQALEAAFDDAEKFELLLRNLPIGRTFFDVHDSDARHRFVGQDPRNAALWARSWRARLRIFEMLNNPGKDRNHGVSEIRRIVGQLIHTHSVENPQALQKESEILIQSHWTEWGRWMSIPELQMILHHRMLYNTAGYASFTPFGGDYPATDETRRFHAREKAGRGIWQVFLIFRVPNIRYENAEINVTALPHEGGEKLPPDYLADLLDLNHKNIVSIAKTLELAEQDGELAILDAKYIDWHSSLSITRWASGQGLFSPGTDMRVMEMLFVEASRHFTHTEHSA